jgi:BirA family transcriptional regulator, biotin operon repressor / biotin---[acetyl-CoA-carboxylase] ligase
MYDLAALEAALTGTVFAGKLHFLSVTDSTNADALAAARSGAPHGSVYFTDEQQAGRGRSDHAWRSSPGDGLYVSVLLRPQIPAARLPLLPLATGLAAAEAIHTVAGITADLRWPNDVLIAAPRTKTCPFTPASKDRSLGTPSPWGPQPVSRKAVGILVEAKSSGGAVDYAVIGIGINVHQRDFAPELAALATSLDLETGHRISRQDLLVSLLKSLQREALGLADSAAGVTVPERVAQASTWIRGRRVEVHGPQACTGVTAGLDENGFLLVRTDNGLVTVQTGGIRAEEPRKPCS